MPAVTNKMAYNVSTVHQVLVIMRLTIREARRRKMLWLGLAMGLVFVILFAVGFHFAYLDYQRTVAYSAQPLLQGASFASMFLTAGLYVVNFLTVMVTTLTTVGAISGEIDDHTIHAIAAKPLRRWEHLLGKWIGLAILIMAYITVLAAGVMLSVYFISGVAIPHPVGVMLVLWLEGLVVLSLSFAGGTRLNTLTNGVLVFMLYGVAFVGGWIEQFGAILESQTAVDIGIATSLLLPSEGLWRYAASLLQGSGITRVFTPFTIGTKPTPAFLIYAIFYTLVLLGLAIYSFSKRDF